MKVLVATEKPFAAAAVEGIKKEIDGDPHKQRSMGFNSTQREKPYQNLTSSEEPCNEVRPFGDTKTGVAWLSSARVVRC